MTVHGRITGLRWEPDGDLHIDLATNATLVNAANNEFQDGNLVLEEICQGTVSQADAIGPCSGVLHTLTVPAVGDRVTVTGSYVKDLDHGWMEIHPVTSLTITATPPPPVAVPPPAVPPVHHHHLPPPVGAWCSATATPSNNGYPDSYVHVTSNQPDKEATASDGGHSWSDETDSAGSVTILLFDTPAGSTITVTVGAASCSTAAA